MPDLSGVALIVEDDPLQAEALGRCLEELGMRVGGVSDCAKEALRLVGEVRPDLITLDVHLSGEGEGGIAAATLLRAGDNTPIVFVTGESSLEAFERMASFSATAVLVKPYDRAALRHAVETACARAAEDGAAP